MKLLSVDTIAFTLLGYPMSWIELVGTLMYLWSVWLITKRKILTWPVGIVSVLLFMVLFYQIRLYSDAVEQVYYLAASVYGWWHWVRSPRQEGRVAGLKYSPAGSLIQAAAVTAVLAVAVGFFMARVDVVFPVLFPEPASFPYLDALTTIMSFTAMWLMARRRIESWIYWIVVDVIGIGVYYVKDVRFIALLYVILLILASRGFVSWRAAREQGRL